MARVAVPASTVLGPYPTLPVAANALDMTWTAAEANGTPANENYITWQGSRMLLLVRNTDASVAYYFTLNSVADDKRRTGDVEQFDVGAGEVAAFMLKRPGWLQTSGQIHLEGENAVIEFAVVAVA